MVSFYRLWLLLSFLMIIILLVVGGFTRLSNSGLSIVEWKPVTGIIFPITQEDWIVEKSKYELTPEHKYVNFDISLNEFKKIYLVEYAHRLIARISGLVFLIPFFYFAIKDCMRLRYKLAINRSSAYESVVCNGMYLRSESPRILSYKLYIVLFLGILQGFFGWYMVKSGLISNPYVSHYRLALHFFTALLMLSIIWYEVYQPKVRIQNLGMFCLTIVMLIFTLVQGILGALVAGLKAGMVYNTFPLIDGELFPYEIFFHIDAFDDFLNLFSNSKFIQFIHRLNGVFVVFLSMIILIYSYFRAKTILIDAKMLFFLTISQLFIGVATLIYQVPILLSLLHQIFIIFILMMQISLYKKLS